MWSFRGAKLDAPGQSDKDETETVPRAVALSQGGVSVALETQPMAELDDEWRGTPHLPPLLNFALTRASSLSFHFYPLQISD